MALTEDLPVYHAMYNLLMMVMDARGAFDKSCKYIVGTTWSSVVCNA